ncbi:hypothetical protein PROFUN_03592 [Planoprotostelium fungivorum]|uniref:Uncharacterized protein n=1 Tax=Planoprotostelium fungivorum TaxID=1890364 RepID=A0A2P6MSJ1_9EUKA|nr:hypothetical protein PROFUN_03592 [Planoprotostelium fungivorum]
MSTDESPSGLASTSVCISQDASAKVMEEFKFKLLGNDRLKAVLLGTKPGL